MEKKDLISLTPFDFPLTGKMITSEDSLLLGEGDFRSLINMRYTGKTVRGIQGMTRINVSPTSYLRIDNGFQFKKDQPEESHILAQTTTGAASRIVKSDNSANVPNKDTLSHFLALNSNNRVYFSDAPDGSMMICPGDANYIWCGDESRIAGFYNFDPSGLFNYDYTEQVTNTLSDSKNIATIHTVSATLDSNVMLLLHLNNAVTDSSPATAHTVTNTNVTYDAFDKVFGSYSAVFNGSSAELTVPDNADFNFSGGSWTIDTWVKVTSLVAVNPIYYQNTTNDNDSFKLYIDTDGAVKLLIKASSSTVVSATTPVGSIAINTWYHIEAVESGDTYSIFINGTLLGQSTDTSRAANFTGVVHIGYDLSAFFVGKMDEYRVSNSARHSANFEIPVVSYGATSQGYVAVLSIRKLQGVKFTIETANTSAATVSVFYWNGTNFTLCSSLTDGTSSGGNTLAQTGSILFDSTVSTANLRLVEGSILAYYYLFVFDGIDATTTISYCTVNSPVQELTDIWDGTKRDILSLFEYTTTYSDIIVNVFQQEYVAAEPLTYAQVGGLTSSGYLYLGFSEPLMGIEFTIPDSAYVNTNSSIMQIDYYNGQTYSTVGTLTDGTATGLISLNHSGAVSWLPPSENTEFPTTVASSDKYYYYRIHFTATISADVRIDFISGIPAPKSIKPHRFSIEWQNRNWLFNDQVQYKNQSIASSYGTNCVFNGTDSVTFEYGNDEEVVGAATLFTRFGGTLYDNLIVLKKNALYLIDGYSSDTYRRYTISSKIGCVAPLTIKTCDTSYEISPGLTKHIIIFQSARGIEMFDGNAVTLVSDDIQDFFDPSSDNYINTSIVDTFSSFYDVKNYEYHWLCATGNSVTINREMVYDLIKKKWFEVDRGTGKALNCGSNVEDSLGNKYIYGGTKDGHLELLENGTSMDGNDISYTVWVSDIPLAKSIDYENCLNYLSLVAVSKNVSTSTVLATVFPDGILTGISLPVISQANTAHRFYRATRSCRINGTTHGFKFTVSTNNETIGFEPLIISGFYQSIRENII
jgi:hypothetical protein